MNRIGIELFLEMLEEAVAKKKGEPLPSFIETELSLGVPAFIPESYVVESKERLRYYKLLSSAQDSIAQQDIALELRDRFGVIPSELNNFLSILSFKRFLGAHGVAKADIFAERIKLALTETTMPDPTLLIELVQQAPCNEHRMSLSPPCTLEISFDTQKELIDNLQSIETLLRTQVFSSVQSNDTIA